MPISVRFQIGGHAAAAWTGGNPVLLEREYAAETDTGKFKLGDGVTAWNALPYVTFWSSFARLSGAVADNAALAAALGGKQPADDDLSALAGNSADGFWAHTGAGTGAARTLAAPAAGLTIANPAGVAGNPTFALANDLAALEALGGTNTIYYRSAADTWSAVTIGGTLSFAGGTLAVASAPLLTTSRNIDGVAFNGSADITVIAPGAHAAASKAAPVDADELPLVDSAASNLLKKLTWANLKATLKSYFDTLYLGLSVLSAAWTDWTPTITASSGTITSTGSLTAKYIQVGKLTWFTCTFTITNAGTGAGTLQATLPFTADHVFTFAGRENALSGDQLQGNCSAASNVLSISKYNNNTAIATGAVIRISGFFKAQ